MTAYDVDMAARYALLFVWAPSRLVRELRAFCLPELEQQWTATTFDLPDDAPPARDVPPSALPPLAAEALGNSGGLAARLACPRDQQAEILPRLLAAAQQCTLLTAAVQPLAVAATLKAAVTAAQQQLPPGEAASHPLRVLAAGFTSARAPAERFLRHQLQQLGLGGAPMPGKPLLWCIQRLASKQTTARSGVHPAAAAAEQQQQPEQEEEEGQEQQQQEEEEAGVEYVIALQLAAGRPPPALRRLGPTAMLPELAGLSASLAAVTQRDVVLDPFCGSGSLLAAALQRGAALAVGSDIDDTHFGGRPAGSSGSTGWEGGGSGGSSASAGGVWAGLPGSCALMKANAAELHRLLPAASIDVILTDLPYGYRTAVGVSQAAPGSAGSGSAVDGSAAPGAATAAAPAADADGDWRQLLQVLLQLAAHVLVPSGRLLVWLPCQAPGSLQQQQQQELGGAGAAQGLCLLHFLPESRQSGYPRAAALFRRQAAGSPGAASGPEGRQAALDAALQAAEAGGVPVHRPARQAAGQAEGQAAEDTSTASHGSLHAAGMGAEPGAASQRRGLKYKQARAQASGTAIDVWRWVLLSGGAERCLPACQCLRPRLPPPVPP